ncbi:MAG: hypothetical protein IJS09_07340 [Treponema sp.]|nr:hypothetical protein [Treponema sp.]
MKKNVIAGIFVFFWACAVTMVSCSNAPAVNLEGVWKSSLTYKTDLASELNPLIDIAAIYTKQDNTFTFNADGTYTRLVSTSFYKAESYDKDYTEEMLTEMYGQGDSSFLLKGSYTLNRKRLTLTTASVVIDGSDTEIPYEDFYKEVKSFGASPFEVKIVPVSANEIDLQGIIIKRQ